MATINAKPAAGLLGGAVTTLTIGVLSRYTSYNPSPEEAAAITTLASFGLAWLVPEKAWGKVEANQTDVDAAISEPHQEA